MHSNWPKDEKYLSFGDASVKGYTLFLDNEVLTKLVINFYSFGRGNLTPASLLTEQYGKPKNYYIRCIIIKLGNTHQN